MVYHLVYSVHVYENYASYASETNGMLALAQFSGTVLYLYNIVQLVMCKLTRIK